MRKFKLINANAEEWDLNDRTAFLQHPDGFGFIRDIQSVAAGFDFIETNDEPVQKNPNGDMVFRTYQRYSEFVQFITNTPLVLGYAPADKWFYIDCKVQSLGKGEKDRFYRRLICPINFVAFSTWYDKANTFSAKISSAEGKKYPYTYPYTYVETAAGSTEIVNSSNVESPCRIHIFGEVVNPSWALIQNGQTVADGKVYATIGAGEKLVVDSSPGKPEIAKYTAENVLVQNLYQDSDFDTTRFILVPVGNTLMSFSHEGPGQIRATVEVKQLADTV